MSRQAEAALAAARLRHLLLHGPVQLREGSMAGGVAGVLIAGEQPLYVYGEITGYYLHWLATPNNDREQCQRAAQLAVDWLTRYLAQQPRPPTRVYLHAAAEDWRNQAFFAFDLAMVAGGYARCIHHGLVDVDQSLVQRLDVLLQAFITDDLLKVVLIHGDKSALPQRWSTQGGPFTAKTASRILLLNAVMPLQQPLVQLCQRQLQHYAAMAAGLPPEMLHPTLYAFEGMVLAERPEWDAIAHGLERLLLLQAEDGSLPEAADNLSLRRNDVAAQALRLALLLEARLGDKVRFDAVIHQLAQWLCVQVGVDGTLPFAPGHPPNSWCTMFAEQALRLYVAREQQQVLPLTAADLV